MYTRSQDVAQRLLLAQPLAAVFQTLRVSAATVSGPTWHAIYARQSIASFEYAHGKAPERYAHNARGIQQALRSEEAATLEHAGFFDLFVPIRSRRRVEAVLVTGPFAKTRPTSAEVLERWSWLTGRQGHPIDPEFSYYLSATLDILTLEGDQAQRFERWVRHFAELLAGEGDTRAIFERALSLLPKLENVMFAEQAWEAAATMVDVRREREWHAPHSGGLLSNLGLKRLPEYALVGWMGGTPSDVDPVGEVLKRDEFRRACVGLARATGRAVCGRVGEHAVAFLVCGSGSQVRQRAALDELVRRAAELARRRFGIPLHFGQSSLSGTLPLGARYEQAMSAAERALSRGVLLVHAERAEPRSGSSLRSLGRQLGKVAGERPSALAPSFDRYIQAVVTHSGYRMDLVRTYLEVGFDEATRVIYGTGVLDDKSYDEICQSLERSARDAASVHELSAVYRLAISDLIELVEHPARGARDHALRRALGFVHQHFTERLSSSSVAKLAGFAPAHFCRLFKQREGMSFEQYLRALRIERAKQLLVSTELSAERVGQLSGFALRPYFHRAFKQGVGMTPNAYRKSTASAEP